MGVCYNLAQSSCNAVLYAYVICTWYIHDIPRDMHVSLTIRNLRKTVYDWPPLLCLRVKEDGVLYVYVGIRNVIC